jgi:molecular chaperone GrpE
MKFFLEKVASHSESDQRVLLHSYRATMASRSVARRTAGVYLNRFLAVPAASTRAAQLFRSTATTQNVWVTAASRHPSSSSSSSNRWFSDSSSKTTASEEEPPLANKDAAEEAPAAAAAAEPSKEEQLAAQVKELKDSLLRSLAEQENTRRIALRDVEQARQFAIKSFAKSLLEVSDNLERAMAAVPKDMNKEEHVVLTNLYEGIELTERGLIKAFESNGLFKFGKEGEVFDPNQHEALYEYPDTSKTPGTVGQVMKPGFMLNKRVLRPAEVGVIKKG